MTKPQSPAPLRRPGGAEETTCRIARSTALAVATGLLLAIASGVPAGVAYPASRPAAAHTARALKATDEAHMRYIKHRSTATRLFEEGTMLAIGRALESKLGVWQRRPPVG